MGRVQNEHAGAERRGDGAPTGEMRENIARWGGVLLGLFVVGVPFGTGGGVFLADYVAVAAWGSTKAEAGLTSQETASCKAFRFGPLRSPHRENPGFLHKVDTGIDTPPRPVPRRWLKGEFVYEAVV